METQADHGTFRSYLFFWSGQLVSLLGSSIVQFVIVWWITLETGSALYLGLAAVVGFAPMVLLIPFAGVLVDRWNRKILIAVVDFLQTLATVALISLFWLNLSSVWAVLAMLAARGLCQAFHSPTVQAIMPLMVPRDKLSRMNGLNYVLSGAVTLTGPSIAAFMLTFLKINQVLWIDPSTFLVALVPLLLVRIPSVRTEQGRSYSRRNLPKASGSSKTEKGSYR